MNTFLGVPLPPLPPLPGAAPARRGRGRPKGAANKPKSPGGRPAGVPNRKRLVWSAAEQKLFEHAELLVDALIESALGGDVDAMRAAINRAVPMRRGRPLLLPDAPPLDGLADVIAFHRWLIASVVSGVVTPEEASDLGSLTKAFVESIEAIELEKRVNDLEDKISENQRFSRRL
jgi:hypothetical protein